MHIYQPEKEDHQWATGYLPVYEFGAQKHNGHGAGLTPVYHWQSSDVACLYNGTAASSWHQGGGVGGISNGGGVDENMFHLPVKASDSTHHHHAPVVQHAGTRRPLGELQYCANEQQQQQQHWQALPPAKRQHIAHRRM